MQQGNMWCSGAAWGAALGRAPRVHGAAGGPHSAAGRGCSVGVTQHSWPLLVWSLLVWHLEVGQHHLRGISIDDTKERSRNL